jgi:hypothetical protein
VPRAERRQTGRLTGFAAQSLDGADTTIWTAASREREGTTGTFWNKRHEIRCRFRSPAQIQKLHAIVEQLLADASSLEASTDDRAAMSDPPTQTVR